MLAIAGLRIAELEAVVARVCEQERGREGQSGRESAEWATQAGSSEERVYYTATANRLFVASCDAVCAFVKWITVRLIVLNCTAEAAAGVHCSSWLGG